MAKFASFIARFGPLVAGLALAAETLSPGLTRGFAAQLISLLSLFGVHPDAALVDAGTQSFAAVLLLFGLLRKFLNLLLGYFSGIKPFGK